MKKLLIPNPRCVYGEVRLTKGGVCCTVRARDYKDPHIVIEFYVQDKDTDADNTA